MLTSQPGLQLSEEEWKEFMRMPTKDVATVFASSFYLTYGVHYGMGM